MVVTIGIGEDLQWRHPTHIIVCQIIIYPSRMSNCKFPQPKNICTIIWTMKVCMGHHLPIPISNSLNCSLSFGILMLDTNTREISSMFLPLKTRAEAIQNKYAIIRIITLVHYVSQISDPVLKRCFSNHCLPSSQQKLRSNTDKIRGGILKNSPAMRDILRRLSTISLLNSTRIFDNKLVGGNAIPGSYSFQESVPSFPVIGLFLTTSVDFDFAVANLQAKHIGY